MPLDSTPLSTSSLFLLWRFRHLRPIYLIKVVYCFHGKTRRHSSDFVASQRTATGAPSSTFIVSARHLSLTFNMTWSTSTRTGARSIWSPIICFVYLPLTSDLPLPLRWRQTGEFHAIGRSCSRDTVHHTKSTRNSLRSLPINSLKLS